VARQVQGGPPCLRADGAGADQEKQVSDVGFFWLEGRQQLGVGFYSHSHNDCASAIVLYKLHFWMMTRGPSNTRNSSDHLQ